MSVELIEQSSPELVAAMERLIPQLSRSAKPLTAEQTQALVDQDSVYLFVFRTDKPVIAADGNEVEAGTILGSLSPPACAPGLRTWWSTPARAVWVQASSWLRPPWHTPRRSARAPLT